MVKPTKITNSIRSLRFAQGEMTQADLASRIGVTRQTVIAIEKGRYSPSLEMAFRTAQALDVPLDDVFQHPVPSTDQGDKHPKLSQQAGRFVDEVRKLRGRPDTERLVDAIDEVKDRPDTERLIEEIRKLQGRPDSQRLIEKMRKLLEDQ